MKPRQTTTSTMRITKTQEKMNESKIPKKQVENKAFVLACTFDLFMLTLAKRIPSKANVFENNFVSFSKSPTIEEARGNHRKTLSQVF
jgi:hypothetical protein